MSTRTFSLVRPAAPCPNVQCWSLTHLLRVEAGVARIECMECGVSGPWSDREAPDSEVSARELWGLLPRQEVEAQTPAYHGWFTGDLGVRRIHCFSGSPRSLCGGRVLTSEDVGIFREAMANATNQNNCRLCRGLLGADLT